MAVTFEPNAFVLRIETDDPERYYKQVLSSITDAIASKATNEGEDLEGRHDYRCLLDLVGNWQIESGQLPKFS